MPFQNERGDILDSGLLTDEEIARLLRVVGSETPDDQEDLAELLDLIKARGAAQGTQGLKEAKRFLSQLLRWYPTPTVH